MALSLHSPPAHATTLAPLTDDQMVDASSYIVEGTITEIWVEFDDQDMIWTRARVAVDRTFKGPDTPNELVIDSMGGRIGDAQMSVPSSARFSQGEHVVLFLADIRNGTRLTPVGMELGKYTIRRAPGTTTQLVQRFPVPDAEFYDHRFVPYPAPGERRDLTDLEQTIQHRLAVGWDGKPIVGLSPERLTALNTPTMRRITR